MLTRRPWFYIFRSAASARRCVKAATTADGRRAASAHRCVKAAIAVTAGKLEARLVRALRAKAFVGNSESTRIVEKNRVTHKRFKPGGSYETGAAACLQTICILTVSD